MTFATKRCAHPACTCLVKVPDDYCSEACQAIDHDSEHCHCNHDDCMKEDAHKHGTHVHVDTVVP